MKFIVDKNAVRKTRDTSIFGKRTPAESLVYRIVKSVTLKFYNNLGYCTLIDLEDKDITNLFKSLNVLNSTYLGIFVHADGLINIDVSGYVWIMQVPIDQKLANFLNKKYNL